MLFDEIGSFRSLFSGCHLLQNKSDLNLGVVDEFNQIHG